MTTLHPLRTKSRKISWKDNLPHSTDYDDRFFQPNAIEETNEVFIQGNNLLNRWKNNNSRNFTIGELGFGFGLNFLITIKKWHEESTKNNDMWLDYISIDCYSLKIKDFKKVFESFPELKEFSEEFIKSFPIETNGYTRISFPKYKIRLTLIIDEAAKALESLIKNENNKIDAWYLDGFDPSKNPAMWSDSILKKIANLSNKDSTFSTYTAAGFVRRGLEKNNFKVYKVKGFGNKRHKLQGVYTNDTRSHKSNQLPGKVAIIGAGLAGSCLAFKLAKYGVQVDIFDKNKELIANPMASMYPKFSLGTDARSFLLTQAYFYSYKFYTEILESFVNTGILFLNNNADRDYWIKRINKLDRDDLFQNITAEEINSKNNLNQHYDGIIIKYGANISINELNNKLLNTKNIKIIKDHDFIKYQLEEKIKIIFKNDRFYDDYSHLVICSGDSLKKIIPNIGIKYGAIAGINEKSLHKIKYPINGDGYVLPESNKINWAGSIYSNENLFKNNAIDFEEIIKKNSHILSNQNKNNIKRSWIGTRASLPDYLPVAGQIENNKIFTIGGLGSRGLSLAPLLAEVIMNDICNIPSAISNEIRDAISPLRFK